ncbi:MAG: large subunit ribosomal protein L24 [Glaciecola sp.]|jgi:large subunit ribosomal protein L24|uniref:Large ribosomal subunit protein uL24 n=1 Tax=Brumicola pallidula DSM 14239 = ACAM 615 TaxID=1121922 RepID=K6ZJL4_9ALTE|nr:MULTISPECIES: 50S ribosomal protein L24 [Glaciecola]PKI00737.1 50S ribosomal protein L24 [Glaciecola sp. 33A]GAC29073.1 large subunit ribosomal protein L24 [Glaciecola pallidula DSM 14239 = ACAM 615]
MANKIRRDDEVVVLAGKDKGKQGKVLKVLSSESRLVVEGVSIVKKHQKANPQIEQPGGIIEKEATIHVSNVALVNPATGKADRVGFRVEDEKKVRFFKSNGDLV